MLCSVCWNGYLAALNDLVFIVPGSKIFSKRAIPTEATVEGALFWHGTWVDRYFVLLKIIWFSVVFKREFDTPQLMMYASLYHKNKDDACNNNLKNDACWLYWTEKSNVITFHAIDNYRLSYSILGWFVHRLHWMTCSNSLGCIRAIGSLHEEKHAFHAPKQCAKNC